MYVGRCENADIRVQKELKLHLVTVLSIRDLYGGWSCRSYYLVTRWRPNRPPGGAKIRSLRRRLRTSIKQRTKTERVFCPFWPFLPAARSATQVQQLSVCSFFLCFFSTNEQRPKQPKQTWQHMKFEPQIPNLRSDLTSEAVQRLWWPRRLPKGPKPYKQYAHG